MWHNCKTTVIVKHSHSSLPTALFAVAAIAGAITFAIALAKALIPMIIFVAGVLALVVTALLLLLGTIQISLTLYDKRQLRLFNEHAESITNNRNQPDMIYTTSRRMDGDSWQENTVRRSNTHTRGQL